LIIVKPAGKQKAYARAGVDVDLGNRLKRRIQSLVQRTHGPEVLEKIGSFGGLFMPDFTKLGRLEHAENPGQIGLFEPDFREMREPVLVSSVDGVGTKLKIAFLMGRHDTVGQDLVNHCVDDIAVIGAQPLFFLDYIGAQKLEVHVFQQLLKGFSKACRAAKCAIVGGETAQMWDLYLPGEYDLAGTIVGVVDRHKIIDGSRIEIGDVILGLPSNGLHTNGYSLARKVLFDVMKLTVKSHIPDLKYPLGDELLRVHKNYQPTLAKIPHAIVHGLAHITGGGLIDNLPRVLPNNCDAIIDTTSWHVPPIFRLIQDGGSIDREEMYQVFNMGIGMTIIVPAKKAAAVIRRTGAKRIGWVERGKGKTRLKF
jgi:phosphoribosylformylglycinamidine cyclo-ligase